jgi:hypothetical protein
MDWIAAHEELPYCEYKDEKGGTHSYRWQNTLPFNGKENTVEVNWLEYWLANKQSKATFKISWVKDVEVTSDNITTLLDAGRCRWKIGNECFNTLKNQGYHLTHNYIHGATYLSNNMYVLTQLAFYFHQIFELTEKQFQACRVTYGSKLQLWENYAWQCVPCYSTHGKIYWITYYQTLRHRRNIVISLKWTSPRKMHASVDYPLPEIKPT